MAEKEKASENGITYTYKLSGDEFSLSAPAGESYTAKLDGKSYPAKGRYQSDSVSLKRIDERTIEETDMLDGELVFVVTLTVIPDGKTMTVVETSK